MSSQFNQSGQVTQPPPICRRRPPRGPFRFRWPPSEAELYVSWAGPPGWSDPDRYDFITHAIYDRFLDTYLLNLNPGSPQLGVEINLYPDLEYQAYIGISVYFDPSHFAQALSPLIQTTRNADIILQTPPWDFEEPGHTFRCQFQAIFETVSG